MNDGGVSVWTIVGTIAAVVAALTALWLWVLALRDRGTRVKVAATRREGDMIIVLTARMSRGSPLVIHHSGLRLRDGTRKRLSVTTHYSQCVRLPSELRSNHKLSVSMLLGHVWDYLVLTNHGAEDVDVSFYFEDGAGRYFDWPEWVPTNATLRQLRLPSADDL
jgi:hypothetical protein